ncbi:MULTISPECIES: BTAD domain-containing putative transcriptional regulator [unclassified Amycolatopsis]|uniref:AfsR/SARP family transcriptional regulator n=1 Tax=unclassified Amycolatopsis TaxID=2618356 RepID=UPI0028753783|nr:MULTISPECIES: BTAD domain-containing putative transcriptional regulator [unclassified Amycolatopsis]MDS0137381.1 winged helix-turn-helix domain-containing protein [Amycolatopsis sp. 505]MDS0141576.1 winged helix-turn-helix domain-containing protein [Amycolatopsis sp. CM201R]
MAHFAVLGPLAVESPPGRWVVLRGERQRTLLAVLLLNAGRPVPVDVLVEALWPDGPPKSYTSNLHTYLSRLRERIEGLRVEHGPAGYRLDVEPAELDLLVFRAAVAEGRRTADPVAAAGHYRRALALWRGPVLAGLHVPRLDADIARLESERLAVFEDCVDAELTAGRHGELTGELQAMITEHPLRERLAAQLMIALHRAGQQGSALEVYRRLRTTLIEELGVEPGAEARRVHAAVLRGEDPVPRLAPAVWPVCQLPPDIGDFTGRDTELAELTGVLGAGIGVPVAVLSGEPGAGKSTLAVRAAHRLRPRFPDGQLYVPLAGRDIGEVLADLLRALGVPGPAVPDDVRARAAVFRGRLTDRRVLVVLDDAVDPEHVRTLLPGTPGCAVLVTSRRRLSGLAGAHRLALGPLSGADAAELLHRLAGARVDRERVEAERIITACARLPLALRIAGSRLAIRPHLRLGELAGRLEDEVRRLDELTVSDLAVRSSIALSYEALRPPAQRAFRLLGRCRLADLPAWAVTTLVDDPDEAVEELVEASLLEALGADQTGEGRYRMHDLVRLYAAELDDPVPSEGLRTVLAATLALADEAAARLPRTVPMPPPAPEPPAQPLPDSLVERLLARPDDWFAAERANLVLLIGTLGPRDALLLLDRLGVYLYLHGQYADMRAAYESVSAADPPLATVAEATLTLLRHARGEYEEAAVRYRACAKELESAGDRRTHAWVSANLAHCLIGLGRAEEALEAAAHAHELFTVDGSAAELGWVRAAESAALLRLGRISDAHEVDRTALRAARSSGDARVIGEALHGFAWSSLLTGDDAGALAAIAESVELLRGTMARSALAKSLRTHGAISAATGLRDDATAAFEEARELARELDERPRELSCTRALAAAWIGEGRAAQAIPVLRACLDEFREMGGRAATGLTWLVLHRAYSAAGDSSAAAAAATEAAELLNPRDASAAALRRALLALTERA